MFSFSTDSGKSPAARPRSWQNVALTPGRVPSFIIPPKLPLSISPRLGQVKEDKRLLLSPSSPVKPSHLLHSPRIRAKLSFTPGARRKQAKDDLSDPTTRAAMSLEHVEKITTPYGFRTLAASPHVRRRESLFHKRTQSGPGDCPTPLIPLRWNISSPKPKPREEPCSLPRPERKGLNLRLKSPRAALKTFTPGLIKKKKF